MLRVLVGARRCGVSLLLLLHLGVEMSAFKKVYDSGFCRRVKITLRKGKFHGHRMIWSVIVEDVLKF